MKQGCDCTCSQYFWRLLYHWQESTKATVYCGHHLSHRQGTFICFKHVPPRHASDDCAVAVHTETDLRKHNLFTLWPPGRLLTALSIFPRSAFDGFYLQISLSHGYLLRIRINQVREVSIVYCQWIVIAYGIPFHWKFFCKSGFKFSLWDFCHLSFKNGGLLGWLESRNCKKTKLFAISNSCWCHFTAHICGYISIIAYMDLTIASKKMLAGWHLGLMN